MISIQHCWEGRFEGEYQNGEFFYLGEGDLSLNLPAWSPVDNAFPLSHYHGVNIILLPEEAQREIHSLEDSIGQLSIDLPWLAAQLREGNRLTLFHAAPQIGSIMAGLYGATEGSLALKVLELLVFLCNAGTRPAPPTRYYNRNQVRTVKALRAFLVAHMHERWTLEALSAKFCIPHASMKACFKAVYGQSIGAHLREYRLQAAAERLRSTTLPVGEIALWVGYESPSKFAGAFQKMFGCTPAQYRRNVCPPGALGVSGE